MLHTDPNPFERETDLLEQPQVREEVIIIFEASEYLAKGKWNKALEKIDKYRQLVNSKNQQTESDQSMQMQALMMRAFCLYNLGQLQQTQEILRSLLDMLDPVPEQNQESSHSQSISIANALVLKHKSLAVRVHTLAATVVITQESQIDFKQIKHRLLELMQPQQMRIFLPEVLGTLTGCKYYQPLIELTQIPGPVSHKLAKKHQLVADWKYIAGLTEEALTFKENAVTLWKQLNCHNEQVQCIAQLKDMRQNIKSDYLLRLKKIKVFADGLIKMEQPKIPSNKQTLLKWNIPLLIEKIIPPPMEMKDSKNRTKSISMTESKMKKDFDKKMMLEDIVQKCSSFYEVYKKQIHSETTNLLLNSNFLQEQIRKIRKTLAIMVKLRSKRLRFCWKKIKLKANPQIAVLNPNYLKNSQYI